MNAEACGIRRTRSVALMKLAMTSKLMGQGQSARARTRRGKRRRVLAWTIGVFQAGRRVEERRCAEVKPRFCEFERRDRGRICEGERVKGGRVFPNPLKRLGRFVNLAVR